ncbi:MAG: hypothetical protein GY801_19460 [bacterium]|nr:hypothetical protein [bacterium]
MKQSSLHKEDLAQMGPEYFGSLDKPELVNVDNRLLETAVELWEPNYKEKILDKKDSYRQNTLRGRIDMIGNNTPIPPFWKQHAYSDFSCWDS